MAYILQLETATTMCSVGISLNGKTIALHEINEGYSHAEAIESLVDQALESAKINLNQLDAVAVSKGPGSYTGLRIGVSLAKGLCYGLQIPLISIDTLEAMTHLPQVAHKKEVLIPMLDARRMEVYCQTFENTHSTSEIEAKIIDENSFSELDKPVLFYGPGAEKCLSAFEHRTNFTLISNVWPSAEGQSELAFQKLKAQHTEDVAYFEPYYLKDFVAGKPKKLL